MEGIEVPAAMGMPGQMQQDPYVVDPDLAGNEDVEQWAQEYADMQDRMEKAANSTDYPFEPNNPYMHHDSPFEEGTELLAFGNLAEAALAFEAVCRKDNDNLDAWRLLGTTQAENEKDGLAILALNNARRINPRDLGVHAALSVSHTNEHNTEAAMESLKAWLLYNPQYESLANITVEPDPDLDIEMTDAFFFADPTRFREVKTLYEAAIEMNANDVNLFTNLGVLYNISHDYGAAAEVLRRAVDVNPQDAKLWNKLGASLANGSNAEQALEAYNRALDINPGYVRTMYNMAIAYSNLAKYTMAAKFIIRAIATQEGGTNPTGEVTEMATRAMWDLLRMTLNLLDRDDLVKLTYDRNLEPFIKEFKLEGMV
ncbi:peroxin-5 [Strigomonas culicis]|nr:peroxin-5 [Strigomonas culicis]|eukprot:EPY35765.1 peroxin-5 [Strigomonas culicis]